jgi:hypothetical protein
MLGTRTLRGVQEKNLFVDESGHEYRLVNSWLVSNLKIEKFVLLKKFDDNYWWVIRQLDIKVIE